MIRNIYPALKDSAIWQVFILSTQAFKHERKKSLGSIQGFRVKTEDLLISQRRICRFG